MSSIDKLIVLIILFVAVTLLVFVGIAAMSKQEVPDSEETPELYAQYQENQALAKPFFLGLNGITIFILLIIVLAGVGIAIKAFMRSKSRW